jgi:hypothetical protein
MPTTYKLISSNVLASATGSVTFSSIPSTYTDLTLQMSVRTNVATLGDRINVTVNGSTTGIYGEILLRGDGSAIANNYNANLSSATDIYVNGNTSTASTFASGELYFPNYAGGTKKTLGIFSAAENNASSGAGSYMGLLAYIIDTASAISSIQIVPLTGPNFLANSSFYLYGIKNS